MTYERFDFGLGVEGIRGPNGEMHMRTNTDGTWVVDQDPLRQVFATRCAALDHARFMAGDLVAFDCPSGHRIVESMDSLTTKRTYPCEKCGKEYSFNLDDRARFQGPTQ